MEGFTGTTGGPLFLVFFNAADNMAIEDESIQFAKRYMSKEIKIIWKNDKTRERSWKGSFSLVTFMKQFQSTHLFSHDTEIAPQGF